MSDSLLKRAAVGNAVYATVVVAIDAHYSQHQVNCIEHARARAHTQHQVDSESNAPGVDLATRDTRHAARNVRHAI